MASKNEAKIKFSAETSQFNSGIKSANASMSRLRAELKLNSTQLKGTGDSMQLLQERSSILAQQLESAQEKTQLLTEKQQAAAEIYGENSEEAQKLATQVLYAQEAEEKIAQEIEKTNSQLEEQASVSEEAGSSIEELQSRIEEQESSLQTMTSAYEQACSVYGETSSEAQYFQSQIDTLNSSISENKSALEGMTGAAGEAAEGIGESAGEIDGDGDLMGEAFGLAESAAGNFSLGSIVSLGGVVKAAEEIIEAVLDIKQAYDESVANIAAGTGATGAALHDLVDESNNAWQSYKYGDMTLQDMSNVIGEVNTRFLLQGDAVDKMSLAIAEFAHITGSDAAGSVDMLADNMWDWHLSVEDMPTLMQELTVAGQASGKSAEYLGKALADGAVQFQALGMSQEQALETLVSWTWAGNEASTYTGMMSRAYQNLNGEVENVPEVFQSAISMIEGWDGSLEGLLNATIPGTISEMNELGLTVADVFGDRANSQAFIAGLQNTAFAVDQLGFSFDGMEEQYNATAENMQTTSDIIDQLIRNAQNLASQQMLPTGMESELAPYIAAAESAQEETNGLVGAMDSMGQAIVQSQSVADGTFSAIQTGAEEAGAAAEASISESSESSQNWLEQVAAKGREAASEIQSNMASAARSIRSSMSISPTIKVHATVPQFYWQSTEADPKAGTVPSMGVNWIRYAKAMNRAYVLDGFTPFGMMQNGSVAVGGEAGGREVVVGEDYLERTVQENSGIDYELLARTLASEFKKVKPVMSISKREVGRVEY